MISESFGSFFMGRSDYKVQRSGLMLLAPEKVASSSMLPLVVGIHSVFPFLFNLSTYINKFSELQTE